MGSVTPSGVVYEPLKRFRSLLAGLTSFQTWLAVKDSAEALKSIHYEWTQSETRHVLLYTSGWSSETIARGRAVQALASGFFGVKFWEPVATTYASAPDDALISFMSNVTALMLEAHNASGQGGDLTIYSVQLLDRALNHWADEPDDASGFCVADFRVVYGA